MDFTREPVIETILTPREGYKLVIRNSKVTGQEEFFVEAVEIVSIGGTCFFRSIERPQAFLVPVTDYEVLEVRETRVALKHHPISDKGIKIGSSKQQKDKQGKSTAQAKSQSKSRRQAEEKSDETAEKIDEEALEKKRERRRRGRRRVKDPLQEEASLVEGEEKEASKKPPEKQQVIKEEEKGRSKLLAPPPTLISQRGFNSTEKPSKDDKAKNKVEKEVKSSEKKEPFFFHKEEKGNEAKENIVSEAEIAVQKRPIEEPSPKESPKEKDNKEVENIQPNVLGFLPPSLVARSDVKKEEGQEDKPKKDLPLQKKVKAVEAKKEEEETSSHSS